MRAKEAFVIGQSLGFKFTLLDIGGGFPGSKSTYLTFNQIVSELSPALDTHFPSKTLRIIAGILRIDKLLLNFNYRTWKILCISSICLVGEYHISSLFARS